MSGGSPTFYAAISLILICLSAHEVQAQLSLTSLPEILFNGTNKNIVEGSVVWLYCKVNSVSSSLSVTWNKDGRAVVQDVPHIILRTIESSSCTTLLLVLDNVVFSDAGEYQCTAHDEQKTAIGTTLTITVQASTTLGVLGMISSSVYPTFTLNRTAVDDGDSILLSYTVGYVGDDSSNFIAPSAVWLKDGIETRTTPSAMNVGGERQLNSTLSFTFQTSDAGVYICIFTGGTNFSVYGTNPLRLDTGSVTVPERVSPPVIFLTPPEKLVVEFSTSGGYSGTSWTQNNNALGGSMAAPATLSEFTFFAEIFVREVTTSVDLGIYDLRYAGRGGIGTVILVNPPESPTTILSETQMASVSILEGSNLNLSCKSTGGPVPSIVWTFNDQKTTFQQSDVATQAMTTSTREDGKLIYSVITGNVVSTLHIKDARYPAHNGVYTCTGNNSLDVSANVSSVYIDVIVQVIPEIQLIADARSRVSMGENVILTCTVNRGNPMNYLFNWYHNGTLISANSSVTSKSTTLELQSIMMMNLGIYMCNVTNDAGSSTSNISISLGVPPKLSVSIEEAIGMAGVLIEPICSATGGDVPISLSWIGPETGNTLISLANGTSIATTITPDSMSGYGVYTCVANNSYGTSNITFRLIQPVAPTILSPLSTDEVPALSPQLVTLTCSAKGVPAPNWTWIRINSDGSRTTFESANSTANEEFFVLHLSEPNQSTSNFTIGPTFATESGTYACIASNFLGNSSANIIVTVYETPEVIYPAEGELFNIDEQRNITFTCQASGFPAPSISFVYEGLTLNTTNDRPLESVDLPLEDRVMLASDDSSLNASTGLYIVTRTLTLFRAADFDSGTFSCSASSTIPTYGERSHNVSFNLLVNVAANISEAPLAVTVTSPFIATLNCTASGLPRPTITWTDPDGIILTSELNNSEIMVMNKSERIVESILSVIVTSPQSSGNYICSASNNVVIPQAITSVKVPLTVYVAPNITSYLPVGATSYIVNVTSTATFECVATGVPIPDIQWYRGNDLINTTDIRVTIQDNSMMEQERELARINKTLSISGTTLSDSRKDYRCTAINIAMNGTTSSENFELFVQVPPTIDPVTPVRILANSGDTITLAFIISNAIPVVETHNIKWYYTDSSISGNPDFSSSDFQEITNLTKRTKFSALKLTQNRLNLTITNITQSLTNTTTTDQGRYFLRASNPAGDVSNSIDLIVNGPPQIVGRPKDQEVLGSSGNNASFLCEAIASPPHEVSWSYTGSSGVVMTNIANTTRKSIGKYHIVSNNESSLFGELTVFNVTSNDSGRYTCTASNSVGFVSASALLIVQIAPILVNDGITSPNNTLLNQSVSIFCFATGFPTPNTRWQKDGRELNITNSSAFTYFSFIPRMVSIDNDTMDYKSNDFSGSILDVIMNSNIDVNIFDNLDNSSIVGVLLFNNVIRQSTGNYSCIASNKLPTTASVSITSAPVLLLVLESPDPPVNVSITAVGPLSITVNWIPTFNGYRPVQNFLIYVSNANALNEYFQVADLQSSSITNMLGIYNAIIMNERFIQPYTFHSIRVASCNAIGCSEQSAASQPVRTNQYTSSPPNNVIVLTQSSSSITLMWNIPTYENGIITHYIVSYSGFKAYNESFSQQGSMQFSTSSAEVTDTAWRSVVTGLIPGTTYRIRVAAVNGAEKNNGIGENSTEVLGNTISVPPPAPPAPPMTTARPLSSNVRTYTLEIIRFSEMNGLISHYQVIVVLLPEGTTTSNLDPPDIRYKSNDDIVKYESELCKVKPSRPVAYITAEFGSNLLPADRIFIVGADDNNGKNSPNDRPDDYNNGPLCHSATYTFFIRAYPVQNSASNSQRLVRQVNQRQYSNFTSSNYYPPTIIAAASSNAAGIAVGIIFVLLILAMAIAVAVVFVVMWRRHIGVFKKKEVSNYKMEKLDGLSLNYFPPAQETSSKSRVPLEYFAQHVEDMHLNENCGFFEDYRVIQTQSPSKPCDTCLLPENKPKNRYANIQCFEETRVIMQPIDGADYDYVNANHIDGYNRPKEYIASQGPLPGTVADMWRVVWDYNVPTIVMLTNLVEKMKIKCSQYWPDSGSANYANFTVTLANTISLSDFVIRHFHVKNTRTGETKEVRQFHYISWPDFGVPRHATPLLYFLSKIRSVHKYTDERPILVHCSAGVGRTGTLITIDHELQRAVKENCIDTFSYVVQLRQQRNFMVQTDAQYVFLHDAILEGALSGDTEVTAEQLRDRMKKLQEVDDDEESGYNKEFQKLRQFKVKVSEFSDANDDTNKFKNRVANALPYNYNRVIIKMKPGIGGSDYINASFIDGYTNKKAYIATQGPLENTKEDFWRMVWEKSASVIVMLTQLEEKGKEQCVQYWPSSKEEPEKMDELTVELVDEGRFDDYITRDLKIVELSSGNSRTVRQFHFIAWPENGAPASGAGMVDLVDQVMRRQQQTGDKPIVVHCSAGIGRTGAFCCLSTAIERVKAEGMVDIFYNIKHLRTQRAHMVQSVEQYTFCYSAILEYVQSFSNYSNFQ